MLRQNGEFGNSLLPFVMKINIILIQKSLTENCLVLITQETGVNVNCFVTKYQHDDNQQSTKKPVRKPVYLDIHLWVCCIVAHVNWLYRLKWNEQKIMHTAVSPKIAEEAHGVSARRGRMNTRVCAVSFLHAETLSFHQVTVNHTTHSTIQSCCAPKAAVSATNQVKLQMCFLTILVLFTILSSNC